MIKKLLDDVLDVFGIAFGDLEETGEEYNLSCKGKENCGFCEYDHCGYSKSRGGSDYPESKAECYHSKLLANAVLKESTAFEREWIRKRAFTSNDLRVERKKRERCSIDELPILGGIYEDRLTTESIVSDLVGFVLIKNGCYYKVPFAGVLGPLRNFPRGRSYDEVMSQVPDTTRHYFEREAINYLRQVLSIRNSKDPVLESHFKNLDTPIEIFPDRYQPLASGDSGLAVGLLNNCFAQMKNGIWC